MKHKKYDTYTGIYYVYKSTFIYYNHVLVTDHKSESAILYKHNALPLTTLTLWWVQVVSCTHYRTRHRTIPYIVIFYHPDLPSFWISVKMWTGGGWTESVQEPYRSAKSTLITDSFHSFSLRHMHAWETYMTHPHHAAINHWILSLERDQLLYLGNIIYRAGYFIGYLFGW